MPIQSCQPYRGNRAPQLATESPIDLKLINSITFHARRHFVTLEMMIRLPGLDCWAFVNSPFRLLIQDKVQGLYADTDF
jgi:hypothetical protein